MSPGDAMTAPSDCGHKIKKKLEITENTDLTDLQPLA